MYAGLAKHGKREGKGLYVTEMRVSLKILTSPEERITVPHRYLLRLDITMTECSKYYVHRCRKTTGFKTSTPSLTMRQDAFYGAFFEDKPHGEGLARYCDGSSYTGEFDAGKRHGKGTLEDENGGRAIGTWENDRRNGEFEVKHMLEYAFVVILL